MRRFLLLSLLLITACGRPSAPGSATDYRAPDNSFSARLPSDWKVDETPMETRIASFFGPATGADPFSQRIGADFHPSPKAESAMRAHLASYSSAQAPFVAQEVRVGERTGIGYSFSRAIRGPRSGLRRMNTRLVEFAVPDGFYSLEHTWPAEAEPSPAFEEFLLSFKPDSSPK
ncbi:MAG: hypothetical protein WCU88_10795 [Elusimicrobiota bacterium]|jgi:hypothetical protein